MILVYFYCFVYFYNWYFSYMKLIILVYIDCWDSDNQKCLVTCNSCLVYIRFTVEIFDTIHHDLLHGKAIGTLKENNIKYTYNKSIGAPVQLGCGEEVKCLARIHILGWFISRSSKHNSNMLPLSSTSKKHFPSWCITWWFICDVMCHFTAAVVYDWTHCN